MRINAVDIVGMMNGIEEQELNWKYKIGENYNEQKKRI